ncbi:BTB/POZ domain-containing protein 1/2 [Microdochium nivale]|nr:BTB/POZ domain-containing protein 1/2 [Microdochium nivale]
MADSCASTSPSVPASSANLVTEVIANSGDIILVVGSGASAVKLLVYSQCLKASSKVFEAMFSPRWLQGLPLSEQEPREFELPEDDPAAMRGLCQLLHFQETRITECRELLQFTMHADKYDLVQTVHHQITKRLKRLKPKTTRGRLCHLATAKVAKIKASSNDWTFSLIAEHTGSYLSHLEDELLNIVLGHSTIYCLEEARTRIRMELADLVSPQKLAAQCSKENSRYYNCEACSGASNLQLLHSVQGANLGNHLTSVKILSMSVMDVMVEIQKRYSGKSHHKQYVQGLLPTNACNKVQGLSRDLDRIYADACSAVETSIQD